MTTPIRIAVALGPLVGRDAIEAALLDQTSVALANVVAATPHGMDQLAADHEALVVACADDAGGALEFVARAVQERPERPVVVLYDGSANGFVRQALEAGAQDLVAADLSRGDLTVGRDLAFAIEKALVRRGGRQQGQPTPVPTVASEVVAVLGPKGGTGKTLMACNLAAGIARQGHSVIIVDLDLQFGDVGLAFGLPPQQTIYDLAIAGGSIDADKVRDFLVPHESGVRLLLAPRRPDHAGAVSVGFLRELFATVRQMAEFVVIDTPPAFSPEVIAAIDSSTAACIVAMLDALSLKNTKLALETLDRMGYDPEHIRVVLNRADSRVGVTADDVAELLGRAPDVRVPSHRDITRSVNEATPLVLTHGNAEARRAFEMLASLYAGAGETPGAPEKARKRRRLFGRGKET